jgi:hypothetical protein
VILAPPDVLDVLIAPTVEPVSLADAKRQIGLSEDQDEHNAFIVQKISTARRLIERRLRITMVEQKLRAVWRSCPVVVQLPAPPVLVDNDHPIVVTLAGTALSGSDYTLDTDMKPAEITFTNPASGKLVVEWWAGKMPGFILTPTLQSAILMYVETQFRNRGVLVDDQREELSIGFGDLLAENSWDGRY